MSANEIPTMPSTVGIRGIRQRSRRSARGVSRNVSRIASDTGSRIAFATYSAVMVVITATRINSGELRPEAFGRLRFSSSCCGVAIASSYTSGAKRTGANHASRKELGDVSHAWRFAFAQLDRSAAGRRSSKSVSLLSFSLTVISPPWASTDCFTIGSPSPIPS